jgi:hypothetical protein
VARRMQCKDIPDVELVSFIANKQAEIGMWVCYWNFEPPYSELPTNLLRAKFGKLIDKGYLTGCNCGCRGDYEVTPKGLTMIEEARRG